MDGNTNALTEGKSLFIALQYKRAEGLLDFWSYSQSAAFFSKTKMLQLDKVCLKSLLYQLPFNYNTSHQCCHLFG